MALPHESFIQYLGSQIKPNVYLELGVDEGNTFKLIAPFVSRAIAVDMKMPKSVEDFETYEMKTDEFFADGWFQDEADLIFIDADHTYEGARKDLINSLKILSDDGMIIMHDTDPVSETYKDDPERCGDVYKIIDEIEEDAKGEFEGINVTTLPIGDAGLSLITKKKCSRTQQRSSNPERVDTAGKLKPKFYVPTAYGFNESPYKQY
jgi:hypothetical protein|tara:strand:+ start:592 stop:1212 length:621 start_codon:yes stop_codon:yes gene_type:complete